MKKAIYLLILLSLAQISYAQTSSNMELPYREIPDGYSESYTAGTVTARMLDGLGFRYYWATEGLREEDLNYKPSDDARTAGQTIEHILGLVRVVNNSVNKKPNINGTQYPELDFQEKRKVTLDLIKEASDILKNSSAADFENYKIIFKYEGGQSEFPFWNQLNGPMADAIWHVGQVISFRRSSGNPYNNKAGVFTGKVGE